MNLRKDISTWGLFFTAIGGVVGSGWLFGPFYAVQAAGPAAVLSWLLGGSLMMVIAFTFAELINGLSCGWWCCAIRAI